MFRVLLAVDDGADKLLLRRVPLLEPFEIGIDLVGQLVSSFLVFSGDAFFQVCEFFVGSSMCFVRFSFYVLSPP